MSDVAPLEEDIVRAMREIGLNPNPDDTLHHRVVIALRATRGATQGARLIALQFAFNGELFDAGKQWGAAKAQYENHLDAETERIRSTEGLSATAAKTKARGSERAFELLSASLISEKREQAIRYYLATFKAALDNHRTDRADWRAADSFQAHGHVGEQS